jgi:hypothetical protein
MDLSGRVRKTSPYTEIRCPDHPTRSESLCRLSYPGPCEVGSHSLSKIHMNTRKILPARTVTAIPTEARLPIAWNITIDFFDSHHHLKHTVITTRITRCLETEWRQKILCINLLYMHVNRLDVAISSFRQKKKKKKLPNLQIWSKFERFLSLLSFGVREGW